jgi:membrane protein DedA with SNARE-associated domain
MEVFKELSIFGLNFLKAKKGLRISEAEMEKAEKIINSVGKKINTTADFINKNNLAEPIARGTFKIYKILFYFCLLLAAASLFVIFYADNLLISLLAISAIKLFCLLLLVTSIVVIAIILLIGYAKIRNN